MRNTKKIKLLATALVGCFMSASLFGQTVTLQLQKFGFNDANNEGVAAAFVYAVVVDTTGNGFGGTDWSNIGPSTISNGSFLSDAEGAQTGLYVGGVGNAQFSAAQDLFGYVHNPIVAHDAGRGLGLPNTGDQFGVIWFPNVMESGPVGPGQSFGFYTNDDLLMTPAGTNPDFRGTIPEGQRAAEYTIVPEPSTYAAIFGFGVLLFVFLRRRFKK